MSETSDNETSDTERCDGCGIERHPGALKPVDTPLGKRQLCVSCFGEEPPRTQDTGTEQITTD